MDCISKEEFLKQPKEIQRIFNEWENDNMEDIDLFDYTGKDPSYKNKFPQIVKYVDFECFGDELVQLMSENQLRRFIEDNTKKKISSMLSLEGNRDYLITLGNYQLEGTPMFGFKEYQTNTKNLLEAYWQVALKIAKNENT
ncbi:hypothetical protein AGR56_17850 [Clostridium sp. DMHC 10]|uniref:hypothetical protein n=1 Tax=Clostridium sp. DMHC 10 TaxID=747377 RepID=UPI00069F9808|nr:hypothetical protein [Clostridium sp. DMHC 10]KOF55703.1 hypothetical protein AGR56_17850 [Clostridium sp. DMHC 10]